ncbi:hypothetical protein [Methylobacterium sp. J-070]|uniref:hypothetical protein n=1 Tax=Methylobacterium sp. J-070 TaxID=2836650 RepID=UPI001FBB326C|nr:hypothetical protein [Methylobacterium sp. J-070]MCJ2051672.1 hypothetical protein [Methylobacterium sp. J-070]
MLNAKSDDALDRSAMATRLVQAAEKRSATKRAIECRRLIAELGASPLKAYIALAAAPMIAHAFDRCA